MQDRKFVPNLSKECENAFLLVQSMYQTQEELRSAEAKENSHLPGIKGTIQQLQRTLSDLQMDFARSFLVSSIPVDLYKNLLEQVKKVEAAESGTRLEDALSQMLTNAHDLYAKLFPAESPPATLSPELKKNEEGADPNVSKFSCLASCLNWVFTEQKFSVDVKANSEPEQAKLSSLFLYATSAGADALKAFHNVAGSDFADILSNSSALFLVRDFATLSALKELLQSAPQAADAAVGVGLLDLKHAEVLPLRKEDFYHRTPLHSLDEKNKNNLEMVTMLVDEFGVDPTKPSQNPPYSLLESTASLNVVKYLLAHPVYPVTEFLIERAFSVHVANGRFDIADAILPKITSNCCNDSIRAVMRKLVQVVYDDKNDDKNHDESCKTLVHFCKVLFQKTAPEKTLHGAIKDFYAKEFFKQADDKISPHNPETYTHVLAAVLDSVPKDPSFVSKLFSCGASAAAGYQALEDEKEITAAGVQAAIESAIVSGPKKALGAQGVRYTSNEPSCVSRGASDMVRSAKYCWESNCAEEPLPSVYDR